MPLHRRLPKRGFFSRKRSEEVRLSDLAKLNGDKVDLEILRAAGLVSIHAEQAKIILTGALSRKFSVSGLGVTKGAKAAIEAAGGNVTEFKPEPHPRKLPKKVVVQA